MITLRQAEILLALAMHPTGLTLDQLQAYVYGDVAVSSTTVKAEVSRLRKALPGAIESRPYRITIPVVIDAMDVLARVGAGDARAAAESYVDDVLPASEAPAVRELAVRLEVAVRTLVLRQGDVPAAVRLAERRPYDLEVVEHALRLLPAASPHRALLEGELAAALRD
jgi:hypothetical protein